MTYGKVRFYADENIEASLVEFIREKGFKVEYANELGFSSRDDRFHLQEAKKRKCILLTKDEDYLNHRQFPFHDLKDTAIIILKAHERRSDNLNYGFMLVNLLDEIGVSGNKNLYGLKIEIRGPKTVFHANIDGRIKSDEIDISRENYKEYLFQD